MSTLNDDTPDVLPARASRMLALLWILLFAGRWIGANLLLMAGLTTQPQIEEWDRKYLSPCYLVLLVVTIVVVALRAVRRARPTTLPPPAEPPDSAQERETR